jgi:hypothetical protein
MNLRPIPDDQAAPLVACTPPPKPLSVEWCERVEREAGRLPFYARATQLPRDGERRFQPTFNVAAMTRERLRWAYGDNRAWQIGNGQCPNARADLLAWKRVIRKVRAK